VLYRRVIAVPLVLLVLTTTGCAFFRCIDNSSPEEVQKFQTSKDELWNQAQSLKRWKVIYETQLADQQAEVARMNRELANCQTETARADNKVSELNRAIDGLNAQVKQNRETAQTAAPPPPKETAKEPTKETSKERQPVRIKVLAGDGKMASATSLSKRLGKMGYRVKLIDLAPRSDFQVNTIFFGSGYRTAAATLAKRLGNGTVMKPLTWPSVFNLIIVTGRKS
jgi:hypothetical protein